MTTANTVMTDYREAACLRELGTAVFQISGERETVRSRLGQICRGFLADRQLVGGGPLADPSLLLDRARCWIEPAFSPC